MSAAMRWAFEVEEHVPTELPTERLDVRLGEMLHNRFGAQLDVEFPTPRTGGKWRLKSNGWVGFIPLTSDSGIALLPKVPIRNVFGMLAQAHGLKSFRALEGLYQSSSLADVFDVVAGLLAHRVLRRVQRGLSRGYDGHEDFLPYVRGRLDTARLLREPWRGALRCRYEEYVADLRLNRLVLWPLHLAARSGLCSERNLPLVLRAYRALHSVVTLERLTTREYEGLRYDRLTEDYRTLHALGRFLVEHAGPQHAVGEGEMVPFLVDMNRLFERFVATWLEENLPNHLAVYPQERIRLDGGGGVIFIVDLVLRERPGGVARAVLDTKYKKTTHPSSDDVAQVVAYAKAAGTKEAALVYPTARQAPWCAVVGDVRVRALAFDVRGDLDTAGARFLEALVRVVDTASSG